MFNTNPILLTTLLEDAGSGKIQLPDFQRGWVWDDDRIRGLLASISRRFPVGAVMTLQAGGEIRLKCRLIEGAEGTPENAVGELLLDGQQRLTSLYHKAGFEEAKELLLDLVPEARKRRLQPSQLDKVLESHWVAPDLLRNDEFARFFVERGEELLKLIGSAMGKSIPGGRKVFQNALTSAGLAEEFDQPEVSTMPWASSPTKTVPVTTNLAVR